MNVISFLSRHDDDDENGKQKLHTKWEQEEEKNTMTLRKKMSINFY